MLNKSSKEKLKFEKEFQKKLLALLRLGAWRKDKIQLNKYFKMLGIACENVSSCYSVAFVNLTFVKENIGCFSDEKYFSFEQRTLNKFFAEIKNISSSFHEMVGKEQSFMSEFLATKKSVLVKSHWLVEENIQWWFHERKNRVLAVPESRKKRKSYKKLRKFLLENQVEEVVSRNIVCGIEELEEIVEVYFKNYKLFMKTSDFSIAHRAFREINWALFSIIGYCPRWYPVFKIVLEKNMCC